MQITEQALDMSLKPAPTILVIEDQTHVRKVIERMLSSCGVRVITVPNGREGANVYAEEGDTIQLVLCDYSMPGLNGVETAEEIYQVDPLATVVIMSGFATDEIRNGHPRLSAFLQKPLRLETMKRMADVVISAT